MNSRAAGTAGKVAAKKAVADKSVKRPVKKGAAKKPKKKPAQTAAKRGGAFDAAVALERYRDMLMIRRFEERAGQLYGMGLIGGFCHLYIGQESVAVGVLAALQPDDPIITGYREHGHILARGGDPRAVMAELTGRAAGSSKGKGGSMHLFDPEHAFYGGHGIVGGQVSLGTGLAFAAKYRREPNICAVFLGDGAANQGQVFESFNMASLWKLPVLYIIENNRYGMGTPVERAAAGSGALFRRGEPYGIEGRQIGGTDVFAIEQTAREAAAHVRDGGGPALIEIMTYRYRGHSMSDPDKYRSKDEVQEVKEQSDPITYLRERLIAEKAADEESLRAMDKEIKAAVAEAAEFARQAPEPDAAALYEDVLLPGPAAGGAS